MDTQKRKPMRLFTWITAIFSLVILVSTAGIGIYIWMLGDNSETSELFALSVVFVGVASILCFVVTWTTYASVRWLQIPVWRWMLGGFKGTPDTPLARSVITREQIAEAKKKMSRLQRIFMWVGNVCMALGVIFLLIAMPWHLVLDVTGEQTIGSTANMLFLAGILILFLGMCIFRISISGAKHRNLHC
jgi:uncharacterized membrane protein